MSFTVRRQFGPLLAAICLLGAGSTAALAKAPHTQAPKTKASKTKAPKTKAPQSKAPQGICIASLGSGSLLARAAEEPSPTELAPPLEAAALASFAVFRRPARTSDQVPVFNDLTAQLGTELASFYPAEIRQVATHGRARFFAIPGFVAPARVLSVHCTSAAARKRRSALIERERMRAHETVFCIAEVGEEHSFNSGECETPTEIGEAVAAFAPNLSGGPSVELVPDGVASVRATFPHTARGISTVSENAYLLEVPAPVRSQLRILSASGGGLLGGSGRSRAASRRRAAALAKLERLLAESAPSKLEWLDAAGNLIRAIAPPADRRAVFSTIVGAPVPRSNSGHRVP